jgi:Na+/H+-translocating membrane pyrophosphatase
VRGGSIPLLAWGVLLAVLLVVNAVWTSDTIQVALFGFAAGIVFLGALAFSVASRGESLRRGAPAASSDPEAVPTSSLGAVMVAVGFAALMFGLVFGRFLVYFGAGVVIASLGQVTRELRDERRARRAWQERT